MSLGPSAFDGVEEAHRPGGELGGVGFIGVHMHFQHIARLHPHQDISKDEGALAFDTHGHNVSVANRQPERVCGRHMDVAHRIYDALL